jgi:hypothetical protein
MEKAMPELVDDDLETCVRCGRLFRALDRPDSPIVEDDYPAEFVCEDCALTPEQRLQRMATLHRWMDELQRGERND